MGRQVLDVFDLQSVGIELVEGGAFFTERIADDIVEVAPAI